MTQQQTVPRSVRSSPLLSHDQKILLVILSVAGIVLAAITLNQYAWLFLIVIEVGIVIFCGELLALNLPRRLSRQIKMNSIRSDGSKSKRRASIEQATLGRFKRDAMVCFALTLLPFNVVALTYWFFLPQLNRFRETFEPANPKQQFLSDLILDPAFHIAVFAMCVAIMAYDSLKGIYFRLLADLDDEVCNRAENYAFHDLIKPPAESHKPPQS